MTDESIESIESMSSRPLGLTRILERNIVRNNLPIAHGNTRNIPPKGSQYVGYSTRKEDKSEVGLLGQIRPRNGGGESVEIMTLHSDHDPTKRKHDKYFTSSEAVVVRGPQHGNWHTMTPNKNPNRYNKIS